MTEARLKKTSIGEIPVDWDVVKVKDLGEVITGTTPRTAVKEYWNGSYPFVTPTDISESKYVSVTERTVSEKGLEEGRCIPRGSVVVTCIASIGKVAIAARPCITNQQINAIICTPENDPQYVYYAMAFRTNILKTWAGQTQKPIVKKTLFEKFPIPRPLLPEQRKIALILSNVDEAIRKTDEIIAKTEELKRGLMQQLLTRGIGQETFKKTKIGEIPQEWNLVKLEEIVDSYRNGIYKRSRYYGQGIPSVRMYNIKDGKVNTKGAPLLEVTEKELLLYGLSAGDIVINRVNTIDLVGKAGVVPDGLGTATFESKNIRVRLLRDRCEPDFLAYFLGTSVYYKQIRATVKPAVAQATINQEDLDEIQVCLPSLPEQLEIVSILSNVDAKIEKERQAKGYLEQLKKGLAQLLLTGKVRVKVN